MLEGAPMAAGSIQTYPSLPAPREGLERAVAFEALLWQDRTAGVFPVGRYLVVHSVTNNDSTVVFRSERRDLIDVPMG